MIHRPTFYRGGGYRATEEHSQPVTVPLTVSLGDGCWLDPGDDSTIATAGGSVTTAADKSGYDNDFTAGTSPTHSQSDNSIAFVRASTQYLNGFVVNSTAGTILLWVNPTDLTTPHQLPIGARDGTNWVYVLIRHTSGLVNCGIGNTNVDSTAPISAGAWSFIGLRWSTVNSQQYVNGVLKQIWAAPKLAASNAIMLGCRSNAGAPELHFNGSIGPVYIADYALSDTKIAYLYGLGRMPY